jgi:predicted dehydrogenase
MHTLVFLEPGHFHAALTLRAPQPRVSPEVFVYAGDTPERRDFLARLQGFNARAEHPTAWRPVVRASDDPLAQLLAERPGDVAVVAGRNRGKAQALRRLHAAGLHVLADKPWLVHARDLPDIGASLTGWPLVREMMTGRRDAVARLVKRLVDTTALFGGFEPGDAEAPAIDVESVHHFDKRVDGAPLQRPWWFFDSSVQGSGAADIPTHLVDQAQWLLEATGGAPREVPRLLAARGWSTRVPLLTFAQVTGTAAVPPELEAAVDGDALSVFCNAAVTYRLAGVTARLVARWDVSPPPGGGDTSRLVLRGRTAEVRIEEGAHTGFRRRVWVACRGVGAATERALTAALTAAHAELPGVEAQAVGAGRYEITLPAALVTPHEAQFAELLDELLEWIDGRHWPAALAERTLAKYSLLAEAVAATGGAAAPRTAPSDP